jgi:hypothetical protein
VQLARLESSPWSPLKWRRNWQHWKRAACCVDELLGCLERGKVREKMREYMKEKEEEERVRVLLRGVVISSVPVISSTLISFLFLISNSYE